MLTGPATGCLDVSYEDELNLESTEQALECGSRAESAVQGVLGILGSIPVVGDFVGLPAAVGSLAVSLSCEAQGLTETRADVAGIARQKIEQAALNDVKNQAQTLASEINKNAAPTAESWQTYSTLAGLIEARALQLGFIGVDSWMAAAGLKLGAQRAKLDAQTSMIDSHKVVQELRGTVQQLQAEAQMLESALDQHLKGATAKYEVLEDSVWRCGTPGINFGGGPSGPSCYRVPVNIHKASVTYPNQLEPFTKTVTCDKHNGAPCDAVAATSLPVWAQGTLGAKNSEISGAFYTTDYATFKDRLTGVLASLEEWHARNNLAAGRFTRQSSTFDSGESARAVDGNRDGRWASESVTHTDDERSPYWEVDLGRTQRIEGVVLYNRTDCCTESLSDLDVILYDNQHKQVDAVSRSGQNGPSLEYSINDGTGGNQARFVRVQLKDRGAPRPLQLAEVYVYGMNAARGRPTAQTSTEGEATSARAVDGKANGYPGDSGPSQSKVQVGSAYEQWEVSLGATRAIGDVILWNRTDSGMQGLGGLRVELIQRTSNKYGSSDQTVASAVVGSSGYAWTWNLNGQEGNVVRVRTQTAGQSISLSEVEVFAKFENMRPMLEANALYESELRSYCFSSRPRIGGGYEDYDGYKRCLEERALSFNPTDPAWVSGVKNYCLNSQIGGGYSNYNGYKQCLQERSVQFVPDSAWCSGVGSYCEAQWYPWGGKDRCYWERSCNYNYR